LSLLIKVKRLKSKHPDEEVNLQTISFKGLKEQIMVAMIPGKYIFKKYVKQE